MMYKIGDWLELVAAAHVRGQDTWTRNGVTVRRLPAGAKNALYRIETGEGTYACKLCVADGRRRAAQEYETMRLLHAAGLDIAPEPLCLDKSCAVLPLPAVVYRWLPGSPLQPPLTAAQLAAFLDSIQRIHALRPGDFNTPLGDSWFHQFDFAWYLADLADSLSEYGAWLATTPPDGQALHGRLARLVAGCVEAVARADVDPARERVAVCLCRVDANLDNSLWGADGRLRWIDWEYSGWGDAALDLSELRWHAALTGLSPAQHRWMRDNYARPAGDSTFDQRLAVYDRIIATRWPFITLRWLRTLHRRPDPARRTRLSTDPARVRAQLCRFIERAEGLARVRRDP